MTPIPAPVSDTDAAVIRMAAIATEHGLKHTTYPRFGVCDCTDGTHPWTHRQGTALASLAWDLADAATRDGVPTHVIEWEWWHGSSPARTADRADRAQRRGRA
jgi:hypothetical protein